MKDALTIDRNFLSRFLGHHDMSPYYRLHPGKALVEGEYNGTKDHFECVLFNLLGTARLRDYGLLHSLPFLVRNLVEVLDEAVVQDIAEINIAHYDTKLLRLRNTHGDKDKMEVLHFDIGDMLEYLLKETRQSRVSHTNVFVKRTGLNTLPYHPLGRYAFLGMAIGVTAILAQSNELWKHSWDYPSFSSFLSSLFTCTSPSSPYTVPPAGDTKPAVPPLPTSPNYIP